MSHGVKALLSGFTFCTGSCINGRHFFFCLLKIDEKIDTPCRMYSLKIGR